MNQAQSLALVFFAFLFILFLFLIVCMWKIFTKAGQPGIASIVPIWNTYVLTCGVAKLEIMWFILTFIPLVNIIAGFVIMSAVAKKFGFSGAFVVGLVFLPIVFLPILAFQGQYQDDEPKKKRRYDD